MNYTRALSSLTVYARKIRYGDRLRPQRDWYLIVVVATVLLIVSAGWSYWVFHETSLAESNAKNSADASINTSVIDTVRTVFDKRAAERAHYQTDYRFVDPSR